MVTAPYAFCIEATIAPNAEGSPPESQPLDRETVPSDLNEFNRYAILRLLNGISSKSRKYLDKYQHLEHVKGKPFVLAVAPFDQPAAYLQVNRAIEAALYGYYVDEEAYLAGPRDAPLTAGRMLEVRKGPDIPIPVGVFTDASHAHISAVVFNSCATWGKVRALSDDPDHRIQFAAIRSDPRSGEILSFQGAKPHYQETLLDGLRVYQNPHATNPLEWDALDAPGVLQVIPVDREADEWIWSMDRPPLIFRRVLLPPTPVAPGGS